MENTPGRPHLNLDTVHHHSHGQYERQAHPQQPTEMPFLPPSSSSQLPSDGPSFAPPPPASSSHRDFSGGRRTQSMKEHAGASPASHYLHSGTIDGGRGGAYSQQPGGQGLGGINAFAHGQEGGGQGAYEGGGAEGATALARRNNTVSTASSRLVRLERTRARLALQGAGLSEEDQNFYVPPSPARGGPYAINAPWSDLGHGAASSSSTSLPLTSILGGGSGSGSPASVLSPTGGGSVLEQQQAQAGEAAWRRAEQQQQQQQQQATSNSQPEPKRSSFVVLRGGKGDSALTERRPLQPAASSPSSSSAGTAQAISPPPHLPSTQHQPLQQQQQQQGQQETDQPLRHKNSLKPFLEQERAQQGVVEDWEKGLMDERKSGAEGGDEWEQAQEDWRQTDPYASLATPPLSSSFPTQLSSPFSSTSQPHNRANTFNAHQARRGNTTDPWLPPSAAPLSGPVLAEDDPSLIRRHQSLTSFRQREPSIEQTMGVLSSSPASSSWADHGSDELHQAGGGNRAYGSLALGAQANVVGFGATRNRSGTSPAPLMLHHSHSLGHGSTAPSVSIGGGASGRLGHSNSLTSHHAHAHVPTQQQGPGGTGTLSHSNSLSSRSDSGVGEREGKRLISPVVNVFPGTRSPWSPTEEETKQLSFSSSTGGGGGANGSGSLSRGGSGSSRGSQAGQQPGQDASAYAAATAVPSNLAGGMNGRFADEVRRLDEQMGGMQIGLGGTGGDGRASSVSPQPAIPANSTTTGARRLPPLMTGPDVLFAATGGMPGQVGRAGPASAAAFVPPIGHSHFLGGVGGLDGISENGGAMNGFGGAGANAPGNLLPALQQQHALVQQQLHAVQQQQAQLQQQAQQQQQQQQQPFDLPPLPQHLQQPQFPPQASAVRGNFTALPGAPSAADWARQKDFILGPSGGGGGATPTSAVPLAPSSAATIVPGPFSSANDDPFPLAPSQQDGALAAAGTVDLVGLQQQLQLQHVQQQQQIHALQSQMQKALSAMESMRAQGAVLPAGFELGGAGGGGVGGVGGGEKAVVAETPIDVNSLVQKKGYNPGVFDLRPKNARFFVIKSYTEEDVHKSLKYEIWASTDLGNKRLDRAFRESADKGPIYLFFSVNASGHFAGMAQMLTPVDYSMSSNVWASDKWKGVLKVRWIYIKDVPLSALRHIRLSNTPENKPVTSSRDTQEVPFDAGLEVLRIIASYQSRTSLLQDYAWYEASSRLQAQQQGGANGQDVASQALADFPPYQPGQHYHPQGQQQQHNQAPPPHSTPSPQPPTHVSPPLPPPNLSQSPQQTQPSPKQAPRNPQAGGRRFWNRGGAAPGASNGAPPVPSLPPGQAQQQQVGRGTPSPMQMPPGPPPHLQQQFGGPLPPPPPPVPSNQQGFYPPPPHMQQQQQQHHQLPPHLAGGPPVGY
ncbi:hypothetical protein JCM8547_000178 [Rhodosporidiobolus lusitaniae]